MRAPLRALALLLVMVVGALSPAAAQDDGTEALVEELIGLLQQQDLTAAAARLGDKEFAAVLYIPNVQILAVSAEYAAPALIEEKLASRNYRDIYLDLASASVPETKVFIEDVQANGLKPDAGSDDPFDVYTMGIGAPVPFDGEHDDRGMDEATYRQAFDDAEAAYTRILEALLLELKQSS